MSTDLSFDGSCETDLTRSKMWLCNNLPRRTWKRVYVLGSWYGNMGLILRWSGIDFDHITNIDIDRDYCRKNQMIYEIAKFDRPYRIMNDDCNRCDMRDADLVINTSTNDISTHAWFKRIPMGTTVAIQCRNNQPIGRLKDRPSTFDDFTESFPLSKTRMCGSLTMANRDESYDRYMLIGHK